MVGRSVSGSLLPRLIPDPDKPGVVASLPRSLPFSDPLLQNHRIPLLLSSPHILRFSWETFHSLIKRFLTGGKNRGGGDTPSEKHKIIVTRTINALYWELVTWNNIISLFTVSHLVITSYMLQNDYVTHPNHTERRSQVLTPVCFIYSKGPALNHQFLLRVFKRLPRPPLLPPLQPRLWPARQVRTLFVNQWVPGLGGRGLPSVQMLSWNKTEDHV